MSYIKALQRVMSLDGKVYPEISARLLSLRYALINVFVLGLVYGFSSLYFNYSSLKVFTQPLTILIAQVIIVLSGIVIVFLLHGGTALLIWAFSRGVGGNPNFLASYLNLGISVAPFWFSAPAWTAIFAKNSANAFLFFFAAATTTWGLLSIFVSIKSASGLSTAKMLAAMSITTIFVICFLYLWL